MTAARDAGGSDEYSAAVAPRRRRIAGPTRSRSEARADFDARVAKWRERNPALWRLMEPKAEDIIRWKVELECGCVDELFLDRHQVPEETLQFDPFSDARLPAHERLCGDESHRQARVAPYRTIVAWHARRTVDYPDDPVTPPAGWDPDVWKVIRKPARTCAFFDVELSCGHHTSVPVRDLDWRPGDPHSPSVTHERAQEMLEELEECWGDDPEPGPQEVIDREWWRRWLSRRCPRPDLEATCCLCRMGSKVLGYQRIGPLVVKSAQRRPTESRTERVRERLKALEAEAEKLRQELGDS